MALWRSAGVPRAVAPLLVGFIVLDTMLGGQGKAADVVSHTVMAIALGWAGVALLSRQPPPAPAPA